MITVSYYRNAAAVLGSVFVGHIVLQELGNLLCGFRAFFLAPLGLGGGANLCKYGNWAGKSNASTIILCQNKHVNC